MSESHQPRAATGAMHVIVQTHLQGLVYRKAMLSRLKWQMAASKDDLVEAFLNEIQDDLTVPRDLLDEIVDTYTENVRRWKFPEEHELSGAIPNAVECTFPELIQSIYSAAIGLNHVRSLLLGVNVRLNLRGAYRSIGNALNLVREELELLDLAGEYVATDTPLRLTFPQEEDEGRAPWSSPAGQPLSPRQIAWLADLGQKDPDFSVGYSDGISAHSTPPQLVTEQIKARKDRLLRAQQHREIQDQLRKAMALSCPRCNSAPGKACRSRTGKETTMHSGRHAMVA